MLHRVCLPSPGMSPFTETDLTRFAAKTHDVPAAVRPWWTGDAYQPTAVACREWVGAVNAKGYGRFWSGTTVNRRCWTAHKFAYVAAHGPIPDGWVVDRLCRNIRCVEPDHLQAVTQAESNRRTLILHPPLRNEISERCRNGHLRTEHGRWYSGTLRCGQCIREYSRRYAAARRAQQPPVPASAECRNGHPRTDANTYISAKGSGWCRQCNRDAVRRYRERNRAHPAVA